MSSDKVKNEKRLDKKFYFDELEKLQLDLVHMHDWVKKKALK